MFFLRTESSKKIPAFLSIDVEPDGFQLSRSDPPKWIGYDAMFDLAAGLRAELEKRTGSAPVFGWYFRTDPQVAEVYGRADYALTEFPGRTARLQEKGDYLGVHAHPIRWDGERKAWIHDFADPAWNANCVQSALEAFARWNGAPAQRFRSGAGFLINEVVEVLDQHGVNVELALEPVEPWPVTFTEVPTGIDKSPYIGIHTGCLSAPRTAYRPSRNNFEIAETKACRGLIIVPMTTYVPQPLQPWWKTIFATTSPKSNQGEACVMHLSEEWPSAKTYWDRVAAELESMRRPYLSVAVRTDAPGSPPISRARRLLSAFLDHPLSTRLRFVDPVEVADDLI